MVLALPDFSRARVVVIGDVMVDQYISGASMRVSPEAPVPVLLVQGQKYLPGGAANVAVNLAALGCSTTLLGVYGDDAPGRELVRQLQECGVQLASAPDGDAQTIVKQRMVAHGQQMLRVDFEQPLPRTGPELFKLLEQIIAATDLLILSDYGKGTLVDVQDLIALATRHRVRVLVDPKGRDFTRYRGASIITPNWHEFEQEVGPCNKDQELQQRANELVQQLELEALLITRGEHGMSLFTHNGKRFDVATTAREVFDVTGAGDTVIATLGAALGCFVSFNQAIELANYAAGIVVGRSGVASVTVQELYDQLATAHHSEAGVVDQSQLRRLVSSCRQRGEKLVLTNGCFDLLHAGHATYLQEARSLGDRLIVLVNSDASVTRLKGEGRPLVPVELRMQLLAALSSVDLVCAFEENTPERLIGELLPDVLVKGGDYSSADKIAGATAVQQNGGEVKVLSLVEGISTSDLINKAFTQHVRKQQHSG